jgi:hypothetical protein
MYVVSNVSSLKVSVEFAQTVYIRSGGLLKSDRLSMSADALTASIPKAGIA